MNSNRPIAVTAPAALRDAGAESPVEIPQHPLSRRLRVPLMWLVVGAILVWSWAPTEMWKVANLVTDWRNMAEFGSAFLRPNFHDWELYLTEMVVTIQIAVWGTALAVVFGIPFAILASSNVCPQWIVQPVRRLMDACRAINEIVFALLFVVAVGLGPFAGVMALFIHNVGDHLEAVLGGGRGDRPAPGRGHPGDRREHAAGCHLRRRAAGHPALVVLHALSFRNECAFGDRARDHRRGRDRADALREYPQLPVFGDRGGRHHHCRCRS